MLGQASPFLSRHNAVPTSTFSTTGHPDLYVLHALVHLKDWLMLPGKLSAEQRLGRSVARYSLSRRRSTNRLRAQGCGAIPRPAVAVGEPGTVTVTEIELDSGRR